DDRSAGHTAKHAMQLDVAQDHPGTDTEALGPGLDGLIQILDDVAKLAYRSPLLERCCMSHLHNSVMTRRTPLAYRPSAQRMLRPRATSPNCSPRPNAAIRRRCVPPRTGLQPVRALH